MIAPDLIRRWSGVRPGANLLALDLMEVKRSVELQPWIESVAVERVLPRILKLRVTERQPTAQAYVLRPRGKGAGYEPVAYQIDATGFVMPPLDARLRAEPPGPAEESLPVLMGMDAAELRPGRRADAPQVLAALSLVSAFDRSPMSGIASLKYIDVTGLETLRVTSHAGSEVTFGVDRMDGQLRRWKVIHDAGIRQGAALASLDLSVADYIPSQWTRMNPAQPQPPGKVAKTTRTKRKNV